ncbi:MAG: hypothetical protein JW801_03725 [Bacteroidales bacterium]|nr:hypothetical protein [Bacteroidales bacterium]
MKRFLKKFILFSLIFLGSLELFSRLVVDPFYFFCINTFNEKNVKGIRNILNCDTKHVDYLFIGSSRIPSTINPAVLKELSGGKTVINAGRGYMTAGIHYQALKCKLANYPDYLRNAFVFIEYPGPTIYTSPFEFDKFRVHEQKNCPETAMPHLLLPYLNFSDLCCFFRESHNSLTAKSEMLLLMSSVYRSSEFLNEYFNRMGTVMLFKKDCNDLASEGGIRNDNMNAAIEEARSNAELEKKQLEIQPLLTFGQLEESSLAAIYRLVTQHGGRLILFEMPLHSVQQEIYASSKAQADKEILESWLRTKNIPIIRNTAFQYSDEDFPDTWHLGLNRRDEFSTLLFRQIEKTNAESPNSLKATLLRAVN